MNSNLEGGCLEKELSLPERASKQRSGCFGAKSNQVCYQFRRQFQGKQGGSICSNYRADWRYQWPYNSFGHDWCWCYQILSRATPPTVTKERVGASYGCRGSGDEYALV